MPEIPAVKNGMTLPATLIYASSIVISHDLFETPSCIYIRAVQYTNQYHPSDSFPLDHTFCSWERWATVWDIPLTIKTIEYRNYTDFPDFIHDEISTFKNKNNRVQTMIMERTDKQ